MGISAVYSNVFNFPTQSAIASTNDTKILELSAYKEVIMLKNFHSCIVMVTDIKVSSLMYDDNEQVRIQAAKLLWRLGNLLGTK